MTATDSSAPATNQGRVRVVFAGLLVAMLLASLDQTIFSTALPTIVGELNGVDQMLWVTTAYILASTITMPVYGKLGDLVGRKFLFIGALGLFVLGSIVGGLAGNMTWLIIGRAVQGLGGGGLLILSQSIIADVVPARQRGRYLGVIGAVFGVSSVLGPLLGGWFTEGPGWQWAFWINVPLGLMAIAAAWRFLHAPDVHERPRLDVWGIMTMTVSVTSLVLITSWAGNTYSWDSPLILTLIAVAVVSAAAFVLVERRAAEPIIPLRLFQDRNFVLATAGGLIIAVAMFGAIGYLPTYLQMVTGVSATIAGLLLLPMIGGLMVTALGTGQLVSRTGRYKWMPIASGGITGIGLLLLSTMTLVTPIWVLSAYLFVLGAGIGLGMQILVLIVQNSFPVSQVGTATAANNFFREIGASLGSAVVGSLFSARLTASLTEQLPMDALPAGVTASSLTPEVVQALPDTVQTMVATIYSSALTPVFLYLAPLALLNVLILAFVKETPLSDTLETSKVAPQPNPTVRGF